MIPTYQSTDVSREDSEQNVVLCLCFPHLHVLRALASCDTSWTPAPSLSTELPPTPSSSWLSAHVLSLLTTLPADQWEPQGDSTVEYWPSLHVFSFSLGAWVIIFANFFCNLEKQSYLCKVQLFCMCILYTYLYPAFSVKGFSCCRLVTYTFNQMTKFIILVT